MEKLPGDYIAGFVDGEGCFALKFRRDVRYERKNKPTYFYWDIEFAVGLRGDDWPILERIKKTLSCGTLIMDKRGMAQYSVNNLEDLLFKIVPFFEEHRLQAKKRFDFKLWKRALILLYKNRGLKTGLSTTGNPKGKRREVWDPRDLQQLVSIHKEMAQYKSRRLDGWKWFPVTKSKGSNTDGDMTEKV